MLAVQLFSKKMFLSLHPQYCFTWQKKRGISQVSFSSLLTGLHYILTEQITRIKTYLLHKGSPEYVELGSPFSPNTLPRCKHQRCVTQVAKPLGKAIETCFKYKMNSRLNDLKGHFSPYHLRFQRSRKNCPCPKKPSDLRIRASCPGSWSSPYAVLCSTPGAVKQVKGKKKKKSEPATCVEEKLHLKYIQVRFS